MKKKLSRFFSTFIVLSLVFLAVLAVIYYKRQAGVEISFTEKGDMGVTIKDIHYASTKEGRVVWEVDARSATRLAKKDLLVFDSVKAVFHGDDGLDYTMKAARGVYRESEGVIEASGDVLITSPEGYSLATEKIVYSDGPGEITSSSPVFIKYGELDVRGHGLRVEIKKGRLFIPRDVRAVLKSRALGT